MKTPDVPAAALQAAEAASRREFQLTPRTYRFFHTNGLPELAGVAELQFRDDIESPQRTGKVIAFPSRQGELVYQTLKGGLQFLVTVDECHYFGGTDDNPDDEPNVFLVEVTNDAKEAFDQGGEAGFFESLKPPELKALEQENPGVMVRRQGDIFATWCPAFGKSERGVFDRLLKRQTDDHPNIVFWGDRGDIQFGQTRHRVQGALFTVSHGNEAKKIDVREEYWVGTLSAPDHKPLLLKHPHRLFQAANLVRPRPGCGDR